MKKLIRITLITLIILLFAFLYGALGQSAARHGNTIVTSGNSLATWGGGGGGGGEVPGITNISYAAVYQSTDDYIGTAVNTAFNWTGAEDHTIGVWVYFEDLPGTVGEIGVICGKRASTGDNYYFYVSNSDNILRAIIDGQIFVLINNGSLFVADTWYFMAFVWDGTAATLTPYVNGTMYSSTDITGYSPDVDGNFSFGRQNYQNINGYFDEAFWYDRALTETTLDSIWNNGTTPEDMLDLDYFYAADRIEWLRLEEGTGTSIAGEDGIITSGVLRAVSQWVSY